MARVRSSIAENSHHERVHCIPKWLTCSRCKTMLRYRITDSNIVEVDACSCWSVE